jgi:hypothetical protein
MRQLRNLHRFLDSTSFLSIVSANHDIVPVPDFGLLMFEQHAQRECVACCMALSRYTTATAVAAIIFKRVATSENRKQYHSITLNS